MPNSCLPVASHTPRWWVTVCPGRPKYEEVTLNLREGNWKLSMGISSNLVSTCSTMKRAVLLKGSRVIIRRAVSRSDPHRT